MKKGFSILEVILTITLLGFTLLPLTNILKKAEAVALHSATKKAAIDLASSLLESETFYGNTETDLAIPSKFKIAKETALLAAGIKQVTVNIFWQDEFNKSANIALHRRFYEGVN